MNKIFFSLLFCAFTQFAFGQLNPVNWHFSSKSLDGQEILLKLTAEVQNGWNIYSQYLESDFGPIPTSFVFNESDDFELLGKTEEAGNKKEGFDPLFEMNVTKFSGTVIFSQKVKVLNKSSSITGTLTFMTCDENKCLPPRDIDFSIPLP